MGELFLNITQNLLKSPGLLHCSVETNAKLNQIEMERSITSEKSADPESACHFKIATYNVNFAICNAPNKPEDLGAHPHRRVLDALQEL